MKKKCMEIKEKIKAMRRLKVPDIIKKLNQILTGYFHYYGITDNSKSLSKFRFIVMKSLFYWLNRRSQKKSYTWQGFNDLLKAFPLVTPKIYVSIYDK